MTRLCPLTSRDEITSNQSDIGGRHAFGTRKLDPLPKVDPLKGGETLRHSVDPTEPRGACFEITSKSKGRAWVSDLTTRDNIKDTAEEITSNQLIEERNTSPQPRGERKARK